MGRRRIKTSSIATSKASARFGPLRRVSEPGGLHFAEDSVQLFG